jgi:hypothetical protein
MGSIRQHQSTVTNGTALQTATTGSGWHPVLMTDQPVSTVEAAKAVGVHPGTLQRWVVQGIVKPTITLPGGGYRWDLDDLKHQLAERKGP